MKYKIFKSKSTSNRNSVVIVKLKNLKNAAIRGNFSDSVSHLKDMGWEILPISHLSEAERNWILSM